MPSHAQNRGKSVEARLYKVFNGEDWKTNTLMTAMLYPGIGAENLIGTNILGMNLALSQKNRWM
jgi:hypothetical protein